MADTTIGVQHTDTDITKVTLDYDINSNTDIAVSDDNKGDKSVTLTVKF